MAGIRLQIGVVLSVSLLASAVSAANWQSSGNVTVGGYYSDNICLDSSGSQDYLVGTLRPSIDVRARGARANFSLYAAAEYNSAADHGPNCSGGLGQWGNREAIVPSVRGLADLELIEDWLVLEGGLFATRNPIDPFSSGADDNLNRRDNDNISWRYSAGARSERRLGQNTISRIRYNYNEQFNSASTLGDSTENRWEADIGVDPAQARFSTGVMGYHSKIRYDADSLGPAFENEFSSASIRAAFNLTSSWQINGQAGREWNDYVSLRSDNDGNFWDVGVRWAPNTRVTVDAGIGRRFFGSSPRLDISYRHKRSLLSVGYTRTLSIPRDLRSGDFDPQDPFAPDFDVLPGDPLPSDGEPTFIGNTPVLNERWRARYRFEGRRTTMTLSGTYSQQQRAETLAEADFLNVSTTFSRTLASNLRGNLNFGYDESKNDGDVGFGFAQDRKRWRAGFGFTRSLGNNTSLNVGYRFVKQESGLSGNEYEENRIYFTLRHGLW